MKGSRKNSDNDNDVYDESTRDISDEDEECDDDENTTRKIKSNTGQNKTKKTYKKTKTTKRGSLNKNGRNSNKGTRTMTVSDRHREFQDITNVCTLHFSIFFMSTYNLIIVRESCGVQG